MRAAIVFLALVSACYGGFWDECDVDLNHSILGFQNKKIRDDFEGIVLTINKTEITNITTTEGRYIYAEINNDKIEFKTSPHFKDMEKEVSNYYYEVTLDSEIEFHCDKGTTSVRFSQPIEDINNHVPFFNRKVYTYKFGMDIAKDFELTSLMDILATDIDITDNEMTFSIDGDDLEISDVYSYDYEKTHKAELVTIKEITGPVEKDYTISVKDSRSEIAGTATVKIIIVKD